MNETIQLADVSQSLEIAALVNKAYRPDAKSRGWTHESDLVAGDRTSPEQVRQQITPSSPVLIAIRNNEIVGCVQVTHDTSDCWIGMLATLPSEQNSGLGKKMLIAAEAYAVKHFAPKRLMMSVLSSRSELLSFYQRRGYQLTGQTCGYPLEAGVGTPLAKDLHVLELSKLLPAIA
ncbi:MULTISPECIES: GNAT family N-acetyltransferase [Delftia]|jgi:ribosomal protein S18 acetylase RimI-like enzyme|uniref:GNAT family N-acetyltransferase n=1 Tax=Delftia TaxID=80865 RepID=UPI0024485D68|nr:MULTISPECIES: GNAT family N-acetyltransferase [Delftia]MDH2233650.1 GNAT family N-acetyltransferase [Delftia tsuruhatensis]